MAFGKTEAISIAAPNMQTVVFNIEGTSPFVQHCFSQKAMLKMQEAQEGGSTSKSKKQREARDFNADYEAAKHISTEGWAGIPAASFRAAMISACKIAGIMMTRAKLTVFVEGDGFDAVEGVALVRIYGEPEPHMAYTRNETGVCDLRCRPMWREWRCAVKITFDADQMKLQDVANLLTRAGLQVGVGEGRPDSKKSCGMGWGTFRIVEG